MTSHPKPSSRIIHEQFTNYSERWAIPIADGDRTAAFFSARGPFPAEKDHFQYFGLGVSRRPEGRSTTRTGWRISAGISRQERPGEPASRIARAGLGSGLSRRSNGQETSVACHALTLRSGRAVSVPPRRSRGHPGPNCAFRDHAHLFGDGTATH